jgi:hypothetical protein
MNFNPMQMMGMLMNGGKGLNPMNLMMNQLNTNPMFRQAQQMAQGKSPEELKQTCENLCKQRGISFDDAWAQFQSQFPGLK